MYPSRRFLLLGAVSTLAGCQYFASTAGGTPIDMAKMYGDDLADALTASADVFLASPNIPADQKPLVVQAKMIIQEGKQALDAITITSLQSNAVLAAKCLQPDAPPAKSAQVREVAGQSRDREGRRVPRKR